MATKKKAKGKVKAKVRNLRAKGASVRGGATKKKVRAYDSIIRDNVVTDDEYARIH
jgi:hypothetical protein